MNEYRLSGKESLGIEFGSTRIKAVLIDENCNPVASGGYNWENRLENGIWTYPLSQVWEGLQTAYEELNEDVKAKTGEYKPNESPLVKKMKEEIAERKKNNPEAFYSARAQDK